MPPGWTDIAPTAPVHQTIGPASGDQIVPYSTQAENRLCNGRNRLWRKNLRAKVDMPFGPGGPADAAFGGQAEIAFAAMAQRLRRRQKQQKRLHPRAIPGRRQLLQRVLTCPDGIGVQRHHRAGAKKRQRRLQPAAGVKNIRPLP